jgi:hypothetical protein
MLIFMVKRHFLVQEIKTNIHISVSDRTRVAMLVQFSHSYADGSQPGTARRIKL